VDLLATSKGSRVALCESPGQCQNEACNLACFRAGCPVYVVDADDLSQIDVLQFVSSCSMFWQTQRSHVTSLPGKFWRVTLLIPVRVSVREREDEYGLLPGTNVSVKCGRRVSGHGILNDVGSVTCALWFQIRATTDLMVCTHNRVNYR
jgi:hypothetical protein